MTKSKSIRRYCLECAGESTKDVAFCTAPACPLWEHRLGVRLDSTRGSGIMKKNCETYRKDYEALKEYGVDPALYQPRTPRRIRPIASNKGLEALILHQKKEEGERGQDRLSGQS